jgi:hypothetical protein
MLLAAFGFCVEKTGRWRAVAMGRAVAQVAEGLAQSVLQKKSIIWAQAQSSDQFLFMCWEVVPY